MFNASRKISRFNWFVAGKMAGCMPTLDQMTDYGTIATLAYYDEGLTLPEACYLGVKLMSSYAWDEGRGVVTTAKAITTEFKYAASTFATGNNYADVPDLGRRGEDPLLLLDELSSLDLEPEERAALVLTSEDYTPEEIAGQLGMDVLKSALAKVRELYGTP